MYSSLRGRTRTGAAEEEPYVLVSLTKSPSPAGTSETDWHRYVITQGHNEIVGHRRGTPEAVQSAIDFIVAQLNQRRSGKNPRAQLTLDSQKKTSAAAP